MINEQLFRLKKDGTPYKRCYCRKPELIENYESAISDKTQTWECHHKLEEYFSTEILQVFDWYFDVDPSELIFLTPSEHASLHAKKRKGVKNGFYGKRHSKKTREKLSKLKSSNNAWFGKRHTEKSKRKISEAKKLYWKNKRGKP